GASFMRALGRPDCVAANELEYVQIAQNLAAQCVDLRTQRAALRAQMAASPLCDIKSYVTDFEELLRAMWASHCAADGRRLITLKS
ncbi:MAG: hypothetical protein V4623_01395, partial [Pseudomonadota bacterium]